MRTLFSSASSSCKSRLPASRKLSSSRASSIGTHLSWTSFRKQAYPSTSSIKSRAKSSSNTKSKSNKWANWPIWCPSNWLAQWRLRKGIILELAAWTATRPFSRWPASSHIFTIDWCVARRFKTSHRPMLSKSSTNRLKYQRFRNCKVCLLSMTSTETRLLSFRTNLLTCCKTWTKKCSEGWYRRTTQRLRQAKRWKFNTYSHSSSRAWSVKTKLWWTMRRERRCTSFSWPCRSLWVSTSQICRLFEPKKIWQLPQTTSTSKSKSTMARCRSTSRSCKTICKASLRLPIKTSKMRSLSRCN